MRLSRTRWRSIRRFTSGKAWRACSGCSEESVYEKLQVFSDISVFVIQRQHLIFHIHFIQADNAQFFQKQRIRQQLFRQNGDAQSRFGSFDKGEGVDAFPDGGRFLTGQGKGVVQGIPDGASRLPEQQRTAAQPGGRDDLIGQREIRRTGGT